MATTLTPISLVWNTLTATAFTALGDDGTAETFEIIPTVPDCRRLIIIIENKEPAEDLAISVTAGDYWYAGSALTGTLQEDTMHMIVLESAGYKDKDDDKISIVLTPNAAATVCAEIAAIQIP